MTLANTDVRSLFESTLDALPDGVLLTDGTRRVVYVNRAFSQLWRIPDDLILQKDDFVLLSYVLDQLLDPEGFLQDVERLQLSAQNTEDEVLLKDGRILSRRSVPFSENGLLTARIWIFTDITEARNASIDDLTGIPNRHAYSREFPTYIGACGERVLSAVAILDVDNFKRYNDQYGHASGDDVLRKVGKAIRHHFTRADDLFFRIGGEEFLMASRIATVISACSVFETLRDVIARLGIEHGGNQPFGTVTASVGLGIFEGPQSAAEVFRHVDAALYQSKQLGRNCITLSPASAAFSTHCQ